MAKPFTFHEKGPAPGWVVLYRGEVYAAFGYGAESDAADLAKRLNFSFAEGLKSSLNTLPDCAAPAPLAEGGTANG